MKSLTTLLLLPLTLCLASACRSTGAAAAANAPAKSQAKSPAELDELKRKAELSEMQLHSAQNEQQSSEQSAQAAIQVAQQELAIARAKLAQFTTLDQQNRIARSALSLQRSRDRAVESDEELRQLELMYKDQDLDDMTSEYVINRGKRDAARTQEALQVQEREHESLTQHDLPLELGSLELDVARKEGALQKALSSAENGKLERAIAVLRAEGELAKAKKELQAAEESSQ